MLYVPGEKRYTENQMLNIILNEKIREADEEELMKAESMNAGSARAVYAYFH